MTIHVAADHAGFELKKAIIKHLEGRGFDVTDHGAYELDINDDYPAFCISAAEAAAANDGDLAIVVGGSGNGEQIAANKVRGVRCALVWSTETAQLARQHNNANAMGIGARMHTIVQALKFVDAFVDEPFSEGERHLRRIGQLSEYESR